MPGDTLDNAATAPSSGRMIALAIGVSDAERLPFLAGALNGARGFHDWAVASGYESRLVSDGDEPVTFARLASELQALLTQSAEPIHRMLLYFAGHGLIREAEEGLWLLSKWHSEMRAVAVEVLRRRLYMYGIRQIAIFADACRKLPPDVDALDLTADAVLGRGPTRPTGTPALDKFIAAQDGTATFAVPGPRPEDDRCLFSGVLLEGLWGTRPSAFSKVVPDKITSSSLGSYLQTEVPALAKLYADAPVVPTALPAFPEGDNYYYGVGPKLSPPTFPPWPPPGQLRGVSQPVIRLDSLESMPEPTIEERLHRMHAPAHFETGAGFAVEGVETVALWTPRDTSAEMDSKHPWWRIGEHNGSILNRPVPVLVELASGTYVATTAIPKFIGSIVCDDRGAAGLGYRRISEPEQETSEAAARALGRMERGGLRAGALLDLAVALRPRKHADPVLGALSAYLYDSIGDLDNIRRIAWAYCLVKETIPYDVALLAQLERPRLDAGGLLCADVPAVPESVPRTEQERQFPWTYEATPPERGVIAGFWPLLRQGWNFLDDPVLAKPELLALTKYLTPARFTSFNRDGATRLAAAFGLQRQAR